MKTGGLMQVVIHFKMVKKLLGGNMLRIAYNGGDWRSKSLALLLMVSTTLDGFYFANCVLADAVLTNFKFN